MLRDDVGSMKWLRLVFNGGFALKTFITFWLFLSELN